MTSTTKPLTQLPTNPSYELACELVDSEDVNLWRDIIARIATKHGIKINSLTKINGWANGLFIVNNEVVIKIVPPNWIGQGKRELAALELIVGHPLPVATPQLLANGSLDGWLYVIINKLEGTNLNEIWKDLDEDNQCSIIKQVVEFANALHKINISHVDKNSELYHDWPVFLQNQAANCYEKHKSKNIPKHLLDTMGSFLANHDHQSKFEHYQLMHTDLHPGNLMAIKQNDTWQLSAVIDFGDALIGPDKYFEYATSSLLMGLGNKNINQTLLQAYGFDIADTQAFQHHLTALGMLRHMGGIDYIMARFPGSEKSSSWEQMTSLFFAL